MVVGHSSVVCTIIAALLVAPASCQEFSIVEFNLNLENAEMNLVFNYPVITPLNNFSTGLTIQSTENGSGPNHTLTGGMLLTSPSQNAITFRLTLYDLEAIRGFSMDENSTYLSATAGILRDHGGNPSQAINSSNALQVNTLQVTTSEPKQPVLMSCHLDINTEHLHLQFSKPVIPSASFFTGITLQSQRSNPTYTLSISGSFIGDTGTYNETVSVNLGNHQSVVDAIKTAHASGIAFDSNDTFVAVDAGIVYDVEGNPSSQTIYPMMITPDTTSPQLLSVRLDVNSGAIVFTFDELMSSANFSEITIQSNTSDPRAQVTFLQNYAFEEIYNRGFTIVLKQTELNAIKADLDVGMSGNNIFISLRHATALDLEGYPTLNLPLNSTLPFQVIIIPDVIRPHVLSFDLDLNLGQLVITFNEPVIPTSNFFTGITFHFTTMYVLMFYGTVDQFYHRTVIKANPDKKDVDGIKISQALGMSNSGEFNVSLSIASGIVNDIAGNPSVSIPDTSPLNVTILKPDITAPQLLYFVLNMDSGELVLNFNEPVSFTLTGITGITIQSDANEPSAVHTLSSSSSAKTGYYLQITVTLQDSDLNAIKADELLAIDINSTFVSVAAGSIQDTQHNLISSTVLPATNVLPDITSPKLNHVSLSGFILSLTFSETVNQDTFDISQIALQPDPSSTDVYQLTGGTISTTGHSVLVELVLSDEDLVYLFVEYNLAAPTGNIYISFTSNLVRDMFQNPIVAAVQAFTEINTGELIIIIIIMVVNHHLLPVLCCE